MSRYIVTLLTSTIGAIIVSIHDLSLLAPIYFNHLNPVINLRQAVFKVVLWLSPLPLALEVGP